MAMQHQYNDDQTDRLVISFVPELSRRIEKAAAQSNLSADEYVRQIMDQIVPSETPFVKGKGGLNQAAIEDLKRYREEIRRAHPDVIFEDSVELLRQAREERTRELEQR